MKSIDLTPQRFDLLERLRIKSGLTAEALVENAKISLKTYLRWQKGETCVRRQTLEVVLKQLGVTLAEFVSNEPNLLFDCFRPDQDTPATAKNLLRISEQLDQMLVSVLQSEKATPENEELYKNLLYGGLLRRGFSLSEFTKRIQTCDRKEFIPQVRLELADDLRKLKVFIRNTPVLDISNPNLLWDCSCLPEEISQLAKRLGHKPQTCTIHSHARGEELMRLTSGEFAELQFRSASILWRQSNQLWPPSIDSVHTLKALADCGVNKLGTDSVLDVGCGTGVLGICFGKNNPSVRRITFADWLLSPLMHTALNAQRNFERSRIDWHSYLGRFDNWIGDRPTELYDLLICTPPYLPAVTGFDLVRKRSPVAGTELITYLMMNRLAKTTYITISSMVEKESKKVAAKSMVSLELIGNRLAVPFRVPHAFRHPLYIQSLLESKLIHFDPKNRYPFWHQIMTYKLTYQNKN